MKRSSCALLLPLFLSGCNLDEFPRIESEREEEKEDIEYLEEMRNFVEELSWYAKGIDEDFLIIPQNGVELISTDGEDTGTADTDYLDAIDGIGQEGLFYGYDAINEPTNSKDRLWIRTFLDLARDYTDIPVLITDYVYTEDLVDDSYEDNANLGYISFAAESEDLDDIPIYPSSPFNENADDIDQLAEARNFLSLIDPQLYATPQQLVNEVSNTNYDLVIIDFFFGNLEYTPAQIEQLKEKNNGGRRLVIAYMNIGQAMEDRYYWQSSWYSNAPAWLEDEDDDLPGNHYVEYWDVDWQAIVFGDDNAYLDVIMDAGFDGVYLDKVNAFEYFQD